MISDFIKTAFSSSNQFASGGLLLLGIGAIGAYFKQVPDTILDWFLKQTTLRLVITDETIGFKWFQWWLDRQHLPIRHVDLNTPLLNGSRTAQFGLAPGTKWFMWHGRPCRVTFFRKETDNAGYGPKRVESIVIQTYGRDLLFFASLVQQMKNAYDTYSSESPSLYRWAKDNGWQSVPSYNPRPLESVILPEGQKEKLQRDIVRFHKSREWYSMMGIPYHRGYLLHGAPGTGKTALVTGLSAHFNARLYLLKLNELMHDEALSNAVAAVPAHSMILLEDVDCVIPKSRTEIPPEEKMESLRGVSLAGLLNVLDGLHTPHGVLFFMTTNHPEKLDPAITRPGRIDMSLEMQAATREQKRALYTRFFPTSPIDETMLTNHGATTMAAFQELLMQTRNNLSQTT